ncbi:aspartyl protease family protein [Streptomyces sp. NPDC001450]
MIDTGASASSLDTALAKDLGFDLDDAPRITVGSALGREKRPVVDSTVRLASRSFVAKLSVNNRSKRETPVLLGRQEVQGLHVAVGKRLLTQPDSTAAPSARRTDRGGHLDRRPARPGQFRALRLVGGCRCRSSSRRSSPSVCGRRGTSTASGPRPWEPL